MSSHHVVREKQEPALLTLDLNGFNDEFLGQLLEWSPTIIASPDTSRQLRSKGIKIDVLLRENNSNTGQPDMNYLFTKQNNLFETAMDWLIANGYPAVNIITGNFEPKRFQPYHPLINLAVFCRSEKIYPVSNGFKKWKPAGEPVHILSAAHDLRVSGLDQVDNDTYITTAGGFIQLNFSDKFIFISEAL